MNRNGISYIIMGIFVCMMPMMINNMLFIIGLNPTEVDINYLSQHEKMFNSISTIFSSIFNIGLYIIGVFNIIIGLVRMSANDEVTDSAEIKKIEVKEREITIPSQVLHKKSIIEEQLENLGSSEFRIRILNLLNKIELLLEIDVIKKDIQHSLTLQRSKSEYIPRVLEQYILIPNEYRHVAVDGVNSPRNIFIEQLNTLENGIELIEKEVVDYKTYNMKVTQRFLSSKFEVNNMEVKLIEKEINN